MEIQKLNSSLQTIFKNKKYFNSSFEKIVNRGFAFPLYEKKDVLFVGINPSYKKGDESACLEYDIKIAVRDYPRYFRKFQDIADLSNIKDNWTYLDLFYFRETSQNTIYEIMKQEDGLSFLCEQLKLTMEVIEFIQPKIIVVCNKGAKQFFGIDKKLNSKRELVNIWMGYDFKSSGESEIITGINHQSILGYKDTKLKGTSVVFSNSITRYTNAAKRKSIIDNAVVQIKKFGL
jgi:hypothetical protein